MRKFLYANEWSTDYQLIMCYIDSTPGVETIDSISQKAYEQVNVVGSDEFVIINNNYSAPMTPPPFQCLKMDSNCQALPFTPEEYSNINRWVNRDESHKFKIDDEGYEGIYFMGRFNIKPIKINGLIYGIEFNFISDYSYGFADEITQTYSGKEFMVYNHSDEIGFLLPKVTLKTLENGDFSLQNSLDNEIFTVKNCKAGEVITLDSKNMIIVSSDTTHKLYNDFNFNYIKLYNTYNERRNVFTSSLNCEMTITYAPVRKVGF